MSPSEGLVTVEFVCFDRIRISTEALFEKDTADMRARYPELPAADKIKASKLFGILDSD